MAEIKDFTNLNPTPKKEESKKVVATEVKKTITEEEKRKYIAYSIIGLIVVGFLFFAINDFGGEKEEKQITEITTPESESEKYNSKVEAIQQGEKENNTNTNNSLMDSFGTEEDEKEEDGVKKMEAEIQKMNKEVQEKDTPAPVAKNTPVVAKKVSSNSIRPIYREKETTVENEVKKTEKISVKDDFGGFFGDSEEEQSEKKVEKGVSSFYAVIKGDQLGVRNKQRVSLILPKDININGKVFKKNTVVYAIASFGTNRVNLTVNNINQVPLNIQAYDAQDGGLGLQVNESLVSETSSEMVNEGANEVNLNGVPFGNTIKKLLTKKNKEHKIDLLNNQKMLLKIER